MLASVWPVEDGNGKDLMQRPQCKTFSLRIIRFFFFSSYRWVLLLQCLACARLAISMLKMCSCNLGSVWFSPALRSWCIRWATRSCYGELNFFHSWGGTRTSEFRRLLSCSWREGRCRCGPSGRSSSKGMKSISRFISIRRRATRPSSCQIWVFFFIRGRFQVRYFLASLTILHTEILDI